MLRDPFYNAIIKGLSGKLDPDAFERCACSLLRKIHPTLVPVRGGCDSGMDGAIADGQGLPLPLICTTQESVISNLKKSLQSYLNGGGTRRNALVATSRELTPRKRKNLEQAAAKLGFTLVQVHTQSSIADLLYHNPEWCLELLNLSGAPPALSSIPRSSRPAFGQSLIGREEDIEWLKRQSGDVLLVAQPGAGKSFLLQVLGKENGWLFVISSDRNQIASGLRELSPSVLIVDDAHSSPTLLSELRHLREELGAKFQIVATCWPSERDSVVTTLNLPISAVHQLELLTREQIVAVIKQTGIVGPDELVHELVNQAEGRPGLAVTLCHLCLNGSVREVVLGDALSRDIRTTFLPMVGKAAAAVLACFGVGGRRGMPMLAVSNALRIPIHDLQDTVTRLAAGGVLMDVGQSMLSVRPGALRHALVRDTFFAGAAPLPPETLQQLIDSAPERDEVIITLIGVRARGGSVPDGFIEGLVSLSESESVWQKFASIGERETLWILENHPDRLRYVGAFALDALPEKTIPMLLSSAPDEREPTLIIDWVKRGRPGSEDSILRRRAVLDATLAWVANNGLKPAALRAVLASLSVKYEETTMPPGSGNMITFHRGLLQLRELREVSGFWPRILPILQRHHVNDWSFLRELVEDWAYPVRFAAALAKPLTDEMQAVAKKFLADISAIPQLPMGMLHWAKRTAKRISFDIPVELDPQFEDLFPTEEPDDWRAAQAQQIERASALAAAWASQSPQTVINRLMEFEAQAKHGAHASFDSFQIVCSEISKRVSDPVSWARALIDANAPGLWAAPFLRTTVAQKNAGWEKLVTKCLHLPAVRGWAVDIVLTMDSAPDELMATTLSNLDGIESWIRTLSIKPGIPEKTVRALLKHPNELVSAAAAIGEWHAEPKGNVRASLKSDWRKAVVACVNEDYQLVQMLKADETLAFDWLKHRLENNQGVSLDREHQLSRIVEALSREQRRALIEIMPPKYGYDELIKLVIGGDLDMFRHLLAQERLHDFHLAPLERSARSSQQGIETYLQKLDDTWVTKAKVAMDAGRSPRDVLGAIHPGGWSWSGNLSNMWASWMEQYAELEKNDDERIREVGKLGHEFTRSNFDRERARERRTAVYGGT